MRFTFGPGKHAAAQALADALVLAISTQGNADAAAAVIRPRLNEGLAGDVQAPPDARLFQVVGQVD